MGLLAVLGPTNCPKTAARTAALTNVMASGNSLCLSMITRKLNTISLFPLKLPRFLPSNEFSRNDSTSVNSGALRARRFALLHSRCNAITKNSVGLDALTLSRKRREFLPQRVVCCPLLLATTTRRPFTDVIKRLSLVLFLSPSLV